ncbi:hypothetical protein ACFQU7_07090 [Pseudoroseomonas wenyumeiae]
MAGTVPSSLSRWAARCRRRRGRTGPPPPSPCCRHHGGAAPACRCDPAAAGPSLTPPQRNHLLALAAPALLDALALAGVFASLACVLLALWDDASVMPTLPLLPVLFALSLAPLLCGQAGGIWSIGRAAWQGLLGGTGRTNGHRMETILTGLLWAAAVAVVLARPWNAQESLGWAGLLLVQSLPAWRRWPASHARRKPATAAPPFAATLPERLRRRSAPDPRPPRRIRHRR